MKGVLGLARTATGRIGLTRWSQAGTGGLVGALHNGSRARRLLSTSTSESELKHFAELASSWWDVQGPQRILHKMNLLRVDYIRDTLQNYDNSSGQMPGYSLDLLPAEEKQRILNSAKEKQGMNILDVGCGGGIMSESLARLDISKQVTGIDLSPDVLGAAKAHQQQDPTLSAKLTYKLSSLEEVEGKFDMITMFEVLEHVDSPAHMMRSAVDRLNPGGWLFLSTINRTPVSYFTTIFMGEHLLKIVPKGTHTWSKYINESELREWVDDQADVQFVRSDGCLFVPCVGWQLTPWNHTVGNYFMALRRRH
uniref:Ubiquinone biosynthesis O-methyltransferase, mitochondrial n=1 Tax=Blastobotrys adeninivorans TaxID=409370 RepID=A0A060T7Z8_BLAAD